jgi:ribonuclease HI
MTPENTGCTLATELRAIFYGIVDIPVDTPITVYTDSRGAAQQVAAWQRGQNKLPPWYSTERSHGNKPTLVQLLERVKESGSLLTVEWVKGHNSNLYNEAADALARLGMRVLTDRLKVADAETRAVRLVSGFIKTIATTTRP